MANLVDKLHKLKTVGELFQNLNKIFLHHNSERNLEKLCYCCKENIGYYICTKCAMFFSCKKCKHIQKIEHSTLLCANNLKSYTKISIAKTPRSYRQTCGFFGPIYNLSEAKIEKQFENNIFILKVQLPLFPPDGNIMCLKRKMHELIDIFYISQSSEIGQQLHNIIKKESKIDVCFFSAIEINREYYINLMNTYFYEDW